MPEGLDVGANEISPPPRAVPEGLLVETSTMKPVGGAVGASVFVSFLVVAGGVAGAGVGVKIGGGTGPSPIGRVGIGTPTATGGPVSGVTYGACAKVLELEAEGPEKGGPAVGSPPPSEAYVTLGATVSRCPSYEPDIVGFGVANMSTRPPDSAGPLARPVGLGVGSPRVSSVVGPTAAGDGVDPKGALLSSRVPWLGEPVLKTVGLRDESLAGSGVAKGFPVGSCSTRPGAGITTEAGGSAGCTGACEVGREPGVGIGVGLVFALGCVASRTSCVGHGVESVCATVGATEASMLSVGLSS